MEIVLDIIDSGEPGRYEVEGEVVVLSGINPTETTTIDKAEASKGFYVPMFDMNLELLKAIVSLMHLKKEGNKDAWLILDNEENQAGLMFVPQ